MNEWQTPDHVSNYLDLADRIPHRREGEGVLFDHLPAGARRILDLGTGDGRLLGFARAARPQAELVGLDFSPPMLEAARKRFAGDPRTVIFEHDLERPFPPMGSFDAVISSFAIHHCPHERKREIYREVYALLEPGGVFLNLEHVASPTPELHRRFLAAMAAEEDPSNKLLDVETQLAWLREIGFREVDCHWKWLELALLAGER